MANSEAIKRILLVPPRDYVETYEDLSEDFRVLTAAAEEGDSAYRRTENPEQADAILFVGSRDATHRDVRSHPLVRRYARRVVLYDTRDRIVPFLRGIYPSVERRYFRRRRMRGGFYLRYLNRSWPELEPVFEGDRFLFSFFGSATTHPIRRRVLALGHPRSLLKDTSSDPGRGFGESASVYEAYRRTYFESILRSHFVLCPRGVGPSSMRIFEAMRGGRVPVVIADAWVPPDGPDWSRFSLRVPEATVEEVPSLLERLESEAPAMGREARTQWESWFSPRAAFRSLGSWAVDLVEGSWARERIDRGVARAQLLRPYFFRYVLLSRGARALRARTPTARGGSAS